MSDLKQTLLVGAVAVLTLAATPLAAQDAARPNILVIWGDDIGWYNVSAYNLGVMGYQTPNIDRIAREGALFTDWYGQQSCTAGRAAFITGSAGAHRSDQGRPVRGRSGPPGRRIRRSPGCSRATAT